VTRFVPADGPASHGGPAAGEVRVEWSSDTPALARLVIDRAERRNALTLSMISELRDALRDLAANTDVRVVVLAGAGPDFCAGSDLEELEGARSEGEGWAHARRVEEALAAIEAHPVPVIAQVHGAAMGGGCQLVLACDLAVAAADARLGIPSGRLGVVVGRESVERLVRSVGRIRAAGMLLTGMVCSGADAAAWGLVNDAVPADALEGRALALARDVAASAPLSVRGSKIAIRLAQAGSSSDSGTNGLAESFTRVAEAAFAGEDLAEGLRAFAERRPPVFGGRR
jgi:enoyl-CoA hydratase/carnithine racemase